MRRWIRGGDRLAILLDAEPDGDRFDLESGRSPANGVVPALLGTNRSIDLLVTGDGSWTAWRGIAALNMAGRPTARLQLTFATAATASGALAPAQFLTGKPMRLTSPTLKVVGDATLTDRSSTGKLTVGSVSLRAVASGAIDLGEGATAT